MRTWLRSLFLFLVLASTFGVPVAVAQPELENGDWESIWVVRPPLWSPGDPNYWMVPARRVTGIAYDQTRDVLYIANPAYCDFGSIAEPCPTIWIWDAMTGVLKTSVGVSGQIQVPTLIVNGSMNVINDYPIYKIDVDDEGRIFCSNIMSSIYNGPCIPGPFPNCQITHPSYLAANPQPLKIYRWNSPTSQPTLVYQTSKQSDHRTPGNLLNTEQTLTRWGDVLTVIGKRGMAGTPPVEVDSVRIYVSGADPVINATGSPNEENREINLFMQDTRPDRLYDYRLAVKLTSPNEGFASHGISVTDMTLTAGIWADNNNRIGRLTYQNITADPWPQYYFLGYNLGLSPDPQTGTGHSGPNAYFEMPNFPWLPQSGRRFLICCDGLPNNNNNPPNNRTSARVMEVTDPSAASRAVGLGDTPPIGSSPFQQIGGGGLNSWLTDIDYKIDIDQITGHPHLILFVMMSGNENGIAAFRSKSPLITPVELTSLQALLKGTSVNLTWQVTAEVNNHGFNVERSFDGGSTFEKIGFVAGRGTTTSPYSYNFDDAVTASHRAAGNVKYRLRQVDNDGRFVESPTVTVFITGQPTSVELNQNYPNPFNPATTISFQLAEQGFVTLKVYDDLGQEVQTLVDELRDAGTHFVTFNGESLPSGTYTYQINAGGSILQKKMVLMK